MFETPFFRKLVELFRSKLGPIVGYSTSGTPYLAKVCGSPVQVFNLNKVAKSQTTSKIRPE